MTIDEAIQNREDCLKYLEGIGKKASPGCVEAMRWSVKALKAFRPVSREQVEKVWTGCEKCRDQANWPSWIEKGFVYCPKCGAPLTSWAWEKQVERLEAMKDGKGD